MNVFEIIIQLDNREKIMIKVFYLVYGLTSGGIERYSVNLYEHLNKKKYNFDFIVSKNNHDFLDDEFEAAGGVKVALGNKKIKNKVIYKIDYLINLIRVAKNSYDIAYFNLSIPADVFKYPLICRVVGIKNIVIHSHNSSEGHISIFKRILNVFGRMYINKIATAKFACSDKAAAWMFGEKVEKQKSYKLINNGLEVRDYDYNPKVREKIRASLEIEPDRMVIGHVGRFVDQKNHKFLLEVFKEVMVKEPNALLMLIGVGELQEAVKEQAAMLGISQNIKFLGEKKNVNELMQGMDVFLLPSLYEGLPVVGVEAQASGLHCVFSNTISSEADITGNVSFLSLNNSAKSWAEKVIESANISRKSEKNKIISSGYDIESATAQVEKTIDQMMK